MLPGVGVVGPDLLGAWRWCWERAPGFWGRGAGRFLAGFTVIFFLSYGCYALGHFAYIAATPDQLKKLGIPWSLNLTGEAGFILALLAGLAVGNFLPRVADFLREAVRPEWYIKTAIVLLGATLGVKERRSVGAGLGRHVPRTVRHR